MPSLQSHLIKFPPLVLTPSFLLFKNIFYFFFFFFLLFLYGKWYWFSIYVDNTLLFAHIYLGERFEDI